MITYLYAQLLTPKEQYKISDLNRKIDFWSMVIRIALIIFFLGSVVGSLFTPYLNHTVILSIQMTLFASLVAVIFGLIIGSQHNQSIRHIHSIVHDGLMRETLFDYDFEICDGIENAWQRFGQHFFFGAAAVEVFRDPERNVNVTYFRILRTNGEPGGRALHPCGAVLFYLNSRGVPLVMQWDADDRQIRNEQLLPSAAACLVEMHNRGLHDPHRRKLPSEIT